MDGSRILVIDDSTTLRKLVEIAMRGTGCEVDFAASGSDGVSRARTSRPDVILLDYLLPDLRSPEVCQRLRDDTATSSVPVVIMSANERSVLDDFRTFATVVDFIAKPFTAAEIRSRLEGVVQRGGRIGRGTIAPGNGQATMASGSTAGNEADGALQLRGDLAATPLLEVLRLLAATHATGTLVIDRTREVRGPATARIWLRRGEILMGSGPDAESSWLGQLTPELRERLHRNLLIGKPMPVTLAEAGMTPATTLPLELHAASARMIGELLDARSGRFAWEPAAALPDFVEAFGRHVSLTTVALEHARRAAFDARSPGVLEHVYDRSPRFSEKLAGARLHTEEQRVLALLDGQATGGDVVACARLAPERGVAILTRLCAADLIHRSQASHGAAARTIAVLDGDGELVAALRAWPGCRSPPLEVIELDRSRSLASTVLEARPAVALVGVAALGRSVLEHELPAIARDSTVAVVCILESPDPPLAAQMLRAGVHAVIAKPVHLTEIERLLPG
jgi:DNA-binding response OmpR family regulator